AVHAADDERGRAVTAADRDDRDEEVRPAARVVRARQLEAAHVLARRLEVDRAVNRRIRQAPIVDNLVIVDNVRITDVEAIVGRRGIALHALSGIDIALWDIKGKAEGKPVSELLGGAKRDRVRAYASMLMPDTPEETAERVGALCNDGFTAVKLGWGPLGQDPRHDVRLAAAAKEAAGDCEILIDAGLGYGSDAKTAIEVARELEQLGIFWLEEPFEPDEYEA